MARGSKLSELEQGKILAYKDSGITVRQIARKLSRSARVIRNFLKDPNRYVARKKRGIRRKLSKQARRRLIRGASNQITSASKLQRSLQLNVSVRRVQQLLQSAPHLQYRKMRSVPWMTDRHLQERAEWARSHMQWNDEWSDVIFTDEKKFNFDGPDGLMYYWHDTRKIKVNVGRRAFGGGSVMVWGAISMDGKSQLAILEGKQTADCYVKTLNDFLLPMIPENRQRPMIFQHDNASIHTANLTRMWLLYRNIKTMEWPAHSPDLNPIENVWGLLARRVYAHGRVFSALHELKSVILDEWHNIEVETIRHIIGSMPERCAAVINNKGHCVS